MVGPSCILSRPGPHRANIRKRLTKTLKLYCYDTCQLCHLLCIRTLDQPLTSPLPGMVFENPVIEERMKARLNAGRNPDLHFYRDDNKVEVDPADLNDADCGLLAEIESSQTYRSDFSRHLRVVDGRSWTPSRAPG